MNKPSYLIAAAAMAFAGLASAGQTFDSPVHQPGEASTMTMGAPNLLTQNPPQYHWPAPVVDSVDTTVLGAGSYNNPVHSQGRFDFHGSASNDSSVPDRAGELSTISGGVPNMMP